MKMRLDEDWLDRQLLKTQEYYQTFPEWKKDFYQKSSHK